jgi:hypothetical protein
VLSPMMTVFVLAVLWLIVVVPMVLRRSDENKRDRSVDGFGRAMRALGRRAPATRAEVFVPREHRGPKAPSSPALASRRPVPAAEEALMYPVDRAEMSAARVQMMARRRRSLTLLGAGTAIFGLLALMMGGLLWFLALPFMAGLGGYLWFLRSQALRDRDRRSNRRTQHVTRRETGYDVTEEIGRFEEAPSSMVRIDDDDIELHNMDTIDLTGLYNEDVAAEAAAQRRAS